MSPHWNTITWGVRASTPKCLRGDKHSVRNTDVPWWQAGHLLFDILSLQKAPGSNSEKRAKLQEKKKEIMLPCITAGNVLKIWPLIHSLENQIMEYCVDTWVYSLRVTPYTNYYLFFFNLKVSTYVQMPRKRTERTLMKMDPSQR